MTWLRRNWRRIILCIVVLLLIAAGSLFYASYKAAPKDATYHAQEPPAAVSDGGGTTIPLQTPAPEAPTDTPEVSTASPAAAPTETAEATSHPDSTPTAIAPSDDAKSVVPMQCSQDVKGVVVPSLDISVKTVVIGLDANNRNSLGSPSHEDRGFVGWYKDGPWPGDPGNVLLDGHTYHNEGSGSVFDKHFGEKLVVGETIRLETDNCVFSYRVDQAWPSVAKDPSRATAAKPSFASLVSKEGGDIYRIDGSSGLTLMTCSGVFDTDVRHHEDVSVVHATLVDVVPI